MLERTHRRVDEVRLEPRVGFVNVPRTDPAAATPGDWMPARRRRKVA